MTHLLDTTALLAFILDETGADEVQELIESGQNRLAVSVLTKVEFWARLKSLDRWESFEVPYCHRRTRYYLDLMPTVTVKLPETLSRSLDYEARRRGVPKSAVIRESLERTLDESREKGGGPSCLDLVADLVGIFDGPADSSTNKEYLFEAFARPS
ncbi:hypothetical protein BH23VER1_BH23VER1_01880 [soil metagenome]